MKVYIRGAVKKAFVRKRGAVLAVLLAVVLAIGLIALQVHFISELLAAELFFALAFMALVGIASSVYLVGMAAESIERCFAAALRGLADFYRRSHFFPNGALTRRAANSR